MWGVITIRARGGRPGPAAGARLSRRSEPIRSSLSPPRPPAQQAPAAPTDITVGGITKPSNHSKLNFPRFGQVLEMPVKEGDVVKKGDVLLSQDDRQERALLEGRRLEDEAHVRV